MKVLIVFVEITEYNLARIQNVYESCANITCQYVYCSSSISGHETNRELPKNAVVLEGTIKDKKKRLKEIFNQGVFDFVIVNGYSDAVRLSCIRLCRKKGIPYAIETDTQLKIPKNPVKRLLKRLLLQKIFAGNSYGFAGGTRQRELFYYYGMKPQKVKVLPMTIDVEEFQKIKDSLPEQAELKKMQGFSNCKTILFVGRFVQEKNLFVLLDAISSLSKKHDDVRLCLIGKGDQKQKIEEYCQQLKIDNVVRIYDYMLKFDLVMFYKMADVFVLPSMFEPWGLVVNEALACNLPVIASSNVGAVDDLIVPDKNGDIFCYSNANQLENLLEKWLYKKDSIEGDNPIEHWNHSTYKKIFIQTLEEIMPNAQS